MDDRKLKTEAAVINKLIEIQKYIRYIDKQNNVLLQVKEGFIDHEAKVITFQAYHKDSLMITLTYELDEFMRGRVADFAAYTGHYLVVQLEHDGEDINITEEAE